MNIKAIYDNGGETFDRYTVYFTMKNYQSYYECLGMSAEPFHPQGFGQHGTGQLGPHNGKRIQFSELPAGCQKAVNQDLNLIELSA